MAEIVPGAVTLSVNESFGRPHLVALREGESTEVAPQIRVKYCELGKTGAARIGIEAPRWMAVFRKELWDALSDG